MIDNITTLITSYENGTISRRHLLQALALMTARRLPVRKRL